MKFQLIAITGLILAVSSAPIPSFMVGKPKPYEKHHTTGLGKRDGEKFHGPIHMHPPPPLGSKRDVAEEKEVFPVHVHQDGKPGRPGA